MSTSIQSLNSYTESHSVASSSSNSDVINQNEVTSYFGKL